MSLLGSITDLVRDHGLWWPDGDPGGCRELAYAWQHAAAACDYAADDAAQAVRHITLDNHGRAIEAFAGNAHNRIVDLRTEAERCRHMADKLLARAEQIDSARLRVEALVGSIVTSWVIGTALGAFTAGISEAAAAEATAKIIAAAAALEVSISAETAALIADIAVYAAIEGFTAGVSDVATQVETAVIDNKDPLAAFSPKELVFAISDGAFNGTFGFLTKFEPTKTAVEPPSRWDEVAERLREFPRGYSARANVRMVATDDEVTALFEELTAMAVPATPWKNYDGRVMQLDDGTQIGLRETSASGGRTIDIVRPDGRRAKVHRHGQ